ncbi:MAG TPA: hypothetical protein VF039_08285 [Longimicrobiales bacterium]
MKGITKRIGSALLASALVFAVACADAETDETGTGDNTILPAEDQTGGAGDMGTGTGTTAPGSNTGVNDTSLTGGTATGETAVGTTTP